ncbi:precorrin-3B synthase, partial [Methylopila musalis]
MADCPGVAHLAEMADGGLARVRAPGGRLRADQARRVAELAEELGSGVLDLTNRANLQIRGLKPDAGRALASALGAIGLYAEGPADRRRNVLLDPLAGLDPAEAADLSALADALDRALTGQDWIGGLSPKFAFALDR